MGASQSIEGATEAQLARVGPFKLRSSEKLAIDAMSEIVTNLLRENNLFNLSKILNYPDGCKELFIVVSSTVDKEFQLLKFPEPRARASMVTMSFIDKDMYSSPMIEGDFTRRKACSEITRFLIRLVTLCAAATASISLNTNLGGATTTLPFELAVSESPLKEEVKNLPNKEFGLVPMDPSMITILKQYGFAEVDATRPHLVYLKGNNALIQGQIGGGSTDIVIDTTKSIVYMPKGDRSIVLGIRFELPDQGLLNLYERATRPTSYQASLQNDFDQDAFEDGRLLAKQYAQQQAALPVEGRGPLITPATQYVPAWQFAQAQQEAEARAPRMPTVPAGQNVQQQAAPAPTSTSRMPIVPGRTPAPTATPLGTSFTRTTQNPYAPMYARQPPTSVTATSVFRGRGRTRRSRAHRRQTYRRRRMVGGERPAFLKVTLTEIEFEGASCRNPSRCEKTEFTLDPQGNTILLQQLVPGYTPTYFINRIDNMFRRMDDPSRKISLVAPTVETADDREKYTRIFEPTLKTYETFQQIEEDMSKSETGTGPAPYRAFLLASELDPTKTKLTTMFCLDKWAEKWLTSTLSYSLLQSLYNDGLDGKPTSPAAEELQILAKSFIGDKLATESTPPGMYAQNLNNLKFYPIPKSLKESYCVRSGTAPPFTNIPADKEILTTAHQQLRKLYDAHIAAVVDIMKNVLTIRRDRKNPTDFRFRLNEKYFKDSRGATAMIEDDIQKMRKLIAKHYFNVEKVYRTALEQLSYTRRGFTPNVVVDTLGRADAALEKEGL